MAGLIAVPMPQRKASAMESNGVASAMETIETWIARLTSERFVRRLRRDGEKPLCNVVAAADSSN
jgi:hypothetical protein